MMTPSDATLERALREAVVRCFKNDDLDALTLKRVRAAVADRLDLAPDFFKTHDKWNSRSKTVITEEVETQERLAEEKSRAPDKEARDDDDDDESPVKARKKGTKQIFADPVGPRGSSESPQVKSKKRKSPQATKRGKPSKNERTADTKVDDDPPSDEDDEVSISGKASERATLQQNSRDSKPAEREDDDSEMSEVLDDSPPPKRRKRSPSASKAEKTKQVASKKSFKPTQSGKESTGSPQDEEIKKLQGWLVKCGVRKVWAVYLKSYPTSKEKISHLKEMLKDVGMEGRYSVEKARQIKERRELAADLEAVQEGEKHWGVDEEGNGEAKPRRRLAKGLAALAQFDDSESSDN